MYEMLEAIRDELPKESRIILGVGSPDCYRTA